MGDRLPYFPFYADDFLAGTLGMPDEQVGVYIKLLALAWSKNGVTDDEARSVSRNDATIDAVLKAKFDAGEDGRYRNEKQEIVRSEQQTKRRAGSKGGSKRASKSQAEPQANGQAKAKPQNQNQNQNHSTEAKPDPKPKSVQTPSAKADDFDRFWDVVHKKIGKENALKAFGKAIQRVKKTNVGKPADYIIDAMKAFAASPAGDPTEHTPIHPATWLNQGRYDDDRSTWQGNGTPKPETEFKW